MSRRDPRDVLPPAEVERLENGMLLGVLPNPKAPVVATALTYLAGTRDEIAEEGGVAHFLEHMMFKGAERFGPGEIDRLTRAAGGMNNAYTSHDATVYHFTFAADRWRRALDIELDRMTSLTLDPVEVDHERQVILEEIAMYEGEPWDALDLAVMAELYDGHCYGRPVLGTRDSLARIDGDVLRAFHRRFYCPANTVLMIAGDVEPEAARTFVEETFAVADRGHAEPRRPAACRPLTELRRIERRQGEVARLLLALPAPSVHEREHAVLRLLLAVLAEGRSSRLHRALVDEGQCCVWVSADVGETFDPGSVVIAAEVIPGVAPEKVEEILLAEIARLAASPPSAEELARAKHIAYADWVFGLEKIENQAMAMATALSLFDREHPWRYLETLLSVEADELAAVIERHLQPAQGGVVGWSLPQEAA